MRRTTGWACVIGLLTATACGSGGGSDSGESAPTDAATRTSPTATTFFPVDSTAPPASATGPNPTETTPRTSTATPITAAPTSTAPTSSAATTVAVPTEPGPLDLTQSIVGLGYSVEGRPLHAERLGEPGGRRMLVIGVIHGDEVDGLAIVEELERRQIPDDIELWVVDSMNPDGLAALDRHNANDVDLNRNFPYRWGPIGVPGDGQYAGPGPASEPETQAIVNLMQQLQPDITIWYHQDLYVVNPSQGREGRVRARYAELTGLPLGEITGGIYTGIAATWARNEFSARDGVAFIVELGPTLSPEEAATHADAVLTIGIEG